ncbi:MAG: hypothetical protein HEQ34_06250 [Sphingorhabdus sp.]|jgi:hypothetical protein|uniref:hypothetical protein n=1 Tax=Sphingorhabdus sp. TaxID=1902408 RepID=UPI0025E80198|nr:hypothetical protein [Sphingorhabdus sp.]MCO4091539.1 hypothetical protein [Sphingorhabdus sp.]
MDAGTDELRAEFAQIEAALRSVETRVVALRNDAAVSFLNKTTALENAVKYYKMRRVRNKIFGTCDLFADPAWDILIDLFIAGEQGRRISVSSACIAAAVPATTALRWVSVLEDNGYISRQPDPNDLRRIFVALTPEVTEKVREYFAGDIGV